LLRKLYDTNHEIIFNTYNSLPCIFSNSATFYHKERYFPIEFDISDQRWQTFKVATYVFTRWHGYSMYQVLPGYRDFQYNSMA